MMEHADAGVRSTKHFLEMNPDCIREVLSYLGVDDLARVSQTCKKLKKYAEEVFEQKHQKHFDCIEIPVRRGDAKAALIFQQFGHLLKSLRINGCRCKEEDVLHYIANRCQKHLVDLELLCVKRDFLTMPDEDKQKLVELLSNLRRLKIVGKLTNCDSITEAVDWTS